LEDYVEIFQYKLRQSNQHQLDPNTLQTLFLKGIQDECLDVLKLMGDGVFFNFHIIPFVSCVDDIQEVIINKEGGLKNSFPRLVNPQGV